ncbi:MULTISPECIES: DUF1660 domain-containing protein [Lactococcus]|uniref:DUF1660 domain-containing protein n=1 Tax=Lactococcus TaxID=1357 RepID=UPI0003779B36|nr:MULTISPECIES: DUF1660 domain-containing protein [Lactococcus]MBS4463492.1 DUF1660 domain-containing protein [Lactococcus garvieae]UKS68874.1 DUF1660 domain-containing protein [Lactococcus garvieae]
MKLLCKLFGHKWEQGYCEDYHIKHFLICKQCDEINWNRSDLDESENVFPEKWLDKHMD